MTPYTFEVFPDEPIFVITLLPDFSLARDLAEEHAMVRQFLDQADKRYFYVLDIRQATLGVEDVISAANSGALGRGSSGTGQDEIPVWKHPNVQGRALITENGLIKLAAKGLNSRAFGNLDVTIVSTLEEALDHCRAVIAQGVN